MKRLVAFFVFIFVLAGCGDSASEGELEASQQRIAELEAELELQAAQQRVADLEEELLQAQESAVATTTAAPVTTTDAPTTTQAVDADEECASNTSPGVPARYRSDPFGWSFEKHVYDDQRVWEYESFINSVGAEIQAELEDMVFSADWSVLDFTSRELQPIVDEIEYRLTSAWCVIDTQDALDMLRADLNKVENDLDTYMDKYLGEYFDFVACTHLMLVECQLIKPDAETCNQLQERLMSVAANEDEFSDLEWSTLDDCGREIPTPISPTDRYL